MSTPAARGERQESDSRPLRSIRFTVDEAQAAADEWFFNCGPAALCAVARLKPDEIRPHLGDFERKGYMNAPMVMAALRSLQLPFHVVNDWPDFGLCRVQFEGPWMDEGVPFAARCFHTHWVAVRHISERQVFDVNATCDGGWLPYAEWVDDLIPWLIRNKKRATGGWHLTHRIEVIR